MKFEYDRVYPYEKILEEIKQLILPTIIDRVNPYDVKETKLRKEDIAEIIYTQIMALGYNDSNVNASLNDLMPTRNPIIYFGPEETDAVNMAIHLCIICKDYSHQVRAFTMFHQMTKELKPHVEVMKNIKMQLIPLTIF